MLNLHFKRPFYYEMLEGKPFTFTKYYSRIRIQTNLIEPFLKNGGKLWASATIGRRWALRPDILRRSLISIGVQHTFLFVIFGFALRS